MDRPKTHPHVCKNQCRYPRDAKAAREFGAKGVGLAARNTCSLEGDRIDAMREMILSDTEEGRRIALAKILLMQRS